MQVKITTRHFSSSPGLAKMERLIIAMFGKGLGNRDTLTFWWGCAEADLIQRVGWR